MSELLVMQHRSLQGPNDFPESIRASDVDCNDQTSNIPLRLRTSQEGQLQCLATPVPPEKKYIVIRPKLSVDIHKVHKLYVGLLRQLPPPSEIQHRWNQTVRIDLEEHLRQATSTLPKSMNDEETITEPVLCMTGKKCSPGSVILPSNTICPKDHIALKPTIWIHCGSRKCKKLVQRTIGNLAYLNHFLETFGMDPAYISRYAPWPAAGERPSHEIPAERSTPNMSFAVQHPVFGWTTGCGIKAKFTIHNSNGIVERYSTMGGLITVCGDVYGLTSAHAIVSYLLATSKTTSKDELELIDFPSDSSSDCETNSDPGRDISSERRTLSMDYRPTESPRIYEETGGIWDELSLPKMLAYVGRGTVSGDYSFPMSAPEKSDFALVDLGVLRRVGNLYKDSMDGGIRNVSGIVSLSDLLPGEVEIITAYYAQPLVGHLLEGDASVIVRGTVMRTKKIQVESPGIHGLSGSWVIKDGKLCGSIYAAYDRSPYLHMLSIESIFEDIAKVLGIPKSMVKVAASEDVSVYGEGLDSLVAHRNWMSPEATEESSPIRGRAFNCAEGDKVTVSQTSQKQNTNSKYDSNEQESEIFTMDARSPRKGRSWSGSRVVRDLKRTDSVDLEVRLRVLRKRDAYTFDMDLAEEEQQEEEQEEKEGQGRIVAASERKKFKDESEDKKHHEDLVIQLKTMEQEHLEKGHEDQERLEREAKEAEGFAARVMEAKTDTVFTEGWFWMCCQCGHMNQYILHDGCSSCNSHWKDTCCKLIEVGSK